MGKRKIFIATICLLMTFPVFSIFFNDFGAFFSAIFRNPKRIGAALPSSRFLANKITKHIATKDCPIKVLEVGAGTGVFTEKILQKLAKDDILDVIEIDPGLCDLLKEKFKKHTNVHVHCLSVLEWSPEYKYDFIVSGLPFNSFGAAFVQDVLDAYKKIIKTGGVLSYFEYMWASGIKKFFLTSEKKQDFLQNVNIRKDFIKQFGFDRDFVFLNIPPAYVYYLRI
ncbi:class I SAM-dependent methyltransferase [Candidatus Dependentiae bacterium]